MTMGQATDLIGEFIFWRRREEEKKAKDVFASGRFEGREYTLSLQREEKPGKLFSVSPRVVWSLFASDLTPRPWGDECPNRLEQVYRADEYHMARATFDYMVKKYGLKVTP